MPNPKMTKEFKNRLLKGTLPKGAIDALKTPGKIKIDMIKIHRVDDTHFKLEYTTGGVPVFYIDDLEVFGKGTLNLDLSDCPLLLDFDIL